MKIYHISLNEYKHYSVDSEFFTDFESVETYIKDIIKPCTWIDTKDKTIYELIQEFNERDGKYAIMLYECDIPNLQICK
jgi:hypothetical protein